MLPQSASRDVRDKECELQAVQVMENSGGIGFSMTLGCQANTIGPAPWLTSHSVFVVQCGARNADIVLWE